MDVSYIGVTALPVSAHEAGSSRARISLESTLLSLRDSALWTSYSTLPLNRQGTTGAAARGHEGICPFFFFFSPCFFFPSYYKVLINNIELLLVFTLDLKTIIKDDLSYGEGDLTLCMHSVCLQLFV